MNLTGITLSSVRVGDAYDGYVTHFLGKDVTAIHVYDEGVTVDRVSGSGFLVPGHRVAHVTYSEDREAKDDGAR